MKSDRIIGILAGQLVKECRINAGYSVWKLSRLIKRSEHQVYRYECGDNRIDLDTLIAVLKALNISPRFFFIRLEEELARRASDIEKQSPPIAVIRHKKA